MPAACIRSIYGRGSQQNNYKHGIKSRTNTDTIINRNLGTKRRLANLNFAQLSMELDIRTKPFDRWQFNEMFIFLRRNNNHRVQQTYIEPIGHLVRHPHWGPGHWFGLLVFQIFMYI